MLRGWVQRADSDGESPGVASTDAGSSQAVLPYGLFHAVQVWPGGTYNTVLDEEHREAPGDGAQPDLCPQSGEEQEKHGRGRSRSRSPTRGGTSGAHHSEDMDGTSLLLTDLKMVVGFGMAAGVDHRVHESEPPWWYLDVLGAGLSLARRGGDRELMNGMLRSSLEQCQDEIFVAQATRWVQKLVEDLGRADGVDTHRELSHVPPAECELGDWAMHTMDVLVLIFEYQRKGGTDCGQGEAEVDGLPAPGSVRPRSRTPTRGPYSE